MFDNIPGYTYDNIEIKTLSENLLHKYGLSVKLLYEIPIHCHNLQFERARNARESEEYFLKGKFS